MVSSDTMLHTIQQLILLIPQNALTLVILCSKIKIQ